MRHDSLRSFVVSAAVMAAATFAVACASPETRSDFDVPWNGYEVFCDPLFDGHDRERDEISAEVYGFVVQKFASEEFCVVECFNESRPLSAGASMLKGARSSTECTNQRFPRLEILGAQVLDNQRLVAHVRVSKTSRDIEGFRLLLLWHQVEQYRGEWRFARYVPQGTS